MTKTRWLFFLFVGLATAASCGTSVSDAPPPGDDDASAPDASANEASTDAGTISDASADADAGFVHPGVLVTSGQLAYVAGMLKADASPWNEGLGVIGNQKPAYDGGDRPGALDYKPFPFADVECSDPGGGVDIGCDQEVGDAEAAYTQALLWNLTGNVTYADNAIKIMNAWAQTLTMHGDTTDADTNAPLQSAWAASVWARAAELMKYTSTRWATPDQKAFADFLYAVYRPEVINGSKDNGNWELSMSEALIAMSVFRDDREDFDAAVAMWNRRVPAYIYYEPLDGPTPIPPPLGYAADASAATVNNFWHFPIQYVNGMSQETCRDLGHVQLGFAAMINAAETARIQGVNLYAEPTADGGTMADRIVAGLEYHAQFLNNPDASTSGICEVNDAHPEDALLEVEPDPTWEIAYNEYGNREGRSLPETSLLVSRIRPTTRKLHMVFETLTHAEVGAAGLP